MSNGNELRYPDYSDKTQYPDGFNWDIDYVENLSHKMPIPPKNVIDEVLEKNPYVGQRTFFQQAQGGYTADFYSYPVDVSTVKWFVDNNLNIEWNIQFIKGGTNINPHIDSRRTHCLMFVIQQGGPDVRTCFFKTKKDLTSYLPVKPLPEEDLTLAIDPQLKDGNWYMLNVQKAHSVVNMTETRICLTRQYPSTPLLNDEQDRINYAKHGTIWPQLFK